MDFVASDTRGQRDSAIAIVEPGGEVRFVSRREMANASSKTNGELTQWLSGLIGAKTG